MGWYDVLKDGINVAQQVDNIPLVQGLIDTQKQILDLIQENSLLKEDNKRLAAIIEKKAKVIRHIDTYISLSDSDPKILFCASCWDSTQKTVQLSCNDLGTYRCPICKNTGYYDKELYNMEQQKLINTIDSSNNQPFNFY
ncbi:MAG: hypothetical protein WBI07_03750 [Mobilitalea sp.]